MSTYYGMMDQVIYLLYRFLRVQKGDFGVTGHCTFTYEKFPVKRKLTPFSPERASVIFPQEKGLRGLSHETQSPLLPGARDTDTL